MSVMKYFEAIAKIPHASFQEEKISNYLKEFAKDRNLKYIQDEMHNIVIFKPASAGYENVEPVMLQAHIDMVAEKNQDSDHDFENDPLELIEKDGYLWANNTTLGADDGVGVAYMMALLDDKDAKHPALECVFTVQEEVGLQGAVGLDTSDLKAKYCIGLDSSGEDETCVSTSGGVRVTLTKDVSFQKVEVDGLRLSIRGLKGGHSGGDIDKERANANKLSGILLRHLQDELKDIRLSSYDAGLKVNAITRESDCVFTTQDIAKAKEMLTSMFAEMKTQYAFSDEDLNFELETVQVQRVLSVEESEAFIDLLFMLPYGVIQKSKAIEDLVITSGNIGTANIHDDHIALNLSLRATQGFVLDTIMRQAQWLADKQGYRIEFSARYPGWDFDPNSKLRARLLEVYEDLRGHEMRETATHGGMELGIWKEKMPELDIISFGPKMYEIHTPQEHLDIASFERTYEVLVKLLESMHDFV